MPSNTETQEQCSVDGCNGEPIADLLGESDGYRCRTCLEYDLNTGKA